MNGGKGDDLINPWELTYDDNDEVEQQNPGSTKTYGFANSRFGSTDMTMRGGEGNDKIWGPHKYYGTILIEGGNGDDSLYGAYGAKGYG